MHNVSTRPIWGKTPTDISEDSRKGRKFDSPSHEIMNVILIDGLGQTCFNTVAQINVF